jgi:hypothetical protein
VLANRDSTQGEKGIFFTKNRNSNINVVFYHQDGAVEKRTVTTNPDGSKSIIVILRTTSRGSDLGQI